MFPNFLLSLREVKGSLLLALLLSVPTFTIIFALFLQDQGTIEHLMRGVLWRYLGNAALLLIGVCVLSFVCGSVGAWLVTMYRFPGSKLFRWMLILPMAMPAYVLAMIYGYLFEPAGPLQELFRDITGLKFGEYPSLDLRNLSGAILMLSLALYPYIYIILRHSFAQHSCHLLDSARVLGISGQKVFHKIALPVTRPALVVGLSLVGMETLADFGTVSFYGVPSFTTGIYRTWYGAGDLIGAAKLSAMLLLLVGGILWIERYQRKEARYYNTTALYHPLPVEQLLGFKAFSAFLFCALPVFFGFLLPVILLGCWSLDISGVWFDAFTWAAMGNALFTGVCVVILALSIALTFAFMMRHFPQNKILHLMVRFAGLGYAIPGSVIAVGVLLPMLWVDKHIANAAENWFGWDVGLLITGSIAAIVLACTIRFMAIALGSVESSLQSITPTMDDAAKILGHSRYSIMSHIHLPMIREGILMAVIMLFVDTIKELPATILLRPFNFETLAIRTYELAMDEQLFAAAAPALLMVTLSLIPVGILAYKMHHSRPGN